MPSISLPASPELIATVPNIPLPIPPEPTEAVLDTIQINTSPLQQQDNIPEDNIPVQKTGAETTLPNQ